METTANDHKLSAAELPAIRSWISFLEIFGTGMPLVRDGAHEFFIAIIRVSDNFNAMSNPSYRLMISELFASLNSLPYNHQVSLASQYGDFCNANYINLRKIDFIRPGVQFVSYWHTFLHGYKYAPPFYFPGLNVPGVINARRDAINALVASWDPTPSKDFIVEQTDANPGNNLLPAAAAKRVVDDWAVKNNMPTKVMTDFEASQRLKMKDMLKSDGSLTAEEYFFIFHLLIGLCTGSTADKELALIIVKQGASSIEYDNDTFINQLIYLSLMYMGNPKGNMKFNGGQRQAMLRDTLAIIKTTDEASVAIKASINISLDILNADLSYPLQDMYNSDKSFTMRLADTLAALEDGRMAINAKLTT